MKTNSRHGWWKSLREIRGSKTGLVRIWIGTLSFACLSLASMQAGVIFVNSSQTNATPDGKSWSTAYPGVQMAIDGSSTGDEIWVAAAIYFEALKPKNGVTLYGGFAGTETDRSQRDYKIYRSILDGGGTNRVVEFASGATNTTLLDGFVITHGSGSLASAIYFNSASSPVVINNLIIRNIGPAIRCWDSSAPLIAFNQIQENSGSNGVTAGIDCVSASPRIYNNLFFATCLYTTLSGGGAIVCNSGQPEIVNNVFVANTLFGASAGVSCANAVLVYSSSAPKILNNTFMGNGLDTTPVLNNQSAQAVIANNLIAFNRSGVGGNPGLRFANNCVYGNTWTNFYGLPDPTGTLGNISVDPQHRPSSCFPDVHLNATSPCRNGGDISYIDSGSLDIDGEPRTAGNAIDIGADQYNPATAVYTPAVVRVSPNGDDSNDGSTWLSAKRTIHSAIDLAAVTGGEIWIQAGVYSENLALRPFACLYGGFAGSETNRNQRDWKQNASIIDGNQRTNVILAQQLLAWSRLDGLVIRNGQALRGAGIFYEGCSFPIVNNTIASNMGRAQFTTTPEGGGLWVGRYASAFVSNNVFTGNQSATGGAIASRLAGTNIIANNTFVSNVATNSRSVSGGGAIYLGQYGKAQILNNFFLSNVFTNASNLGFGYGGAIFCDAYSTKNIIGNTFVSNVASATNGEYAGAIYCAVGATLVANNLIAFNSSGLTMAIPTNVYNNCVFGNGTNYLSMPDLTGTNGNISVDPFLVSPAHFHLSSGSPCIDAGGDAFVLPGSTDLDGQNRIAGAHVDIGADEFGSIVPFVLTLRSGSQGFLLSLTGEPGRQYILECSQELRTWTPFATNSAESGVFEIPVPQTEALACFYRAFAVP